MVKGHRDLWVIGGVVVVVGAGAAVLSIVLSKGAGDGGDAIAHIASMVNRVEERRPGSMTWGAAAQGMGLYNRHTVRAGDLSHARIQLSGGQLLLVGANTTIMLLGAGGGQPIAKLSDGSIRILRTETDVARAPIAVQLPSGSIVKIKETPRERVGDKPSIGDDGVKISVVADQRFVVQTSGGATVQELRVVEETDGRVGAPAPEVPARVEARPEVFLLPNEAVAMGAQAEPERLVIPAAPVMSAVSVGASGGDVTVEVEGAAEGVRYRLEWARDKNFAFKHQVESPFKRLQIAIVDPGQWFLRVIAIAKNGAEGAASSVKVVTVRAVGGAQATQRGSLARREEEPRAIAAESAWDAASRAHAQQGADGGADSSTPVHSGPAHSGFDAGAPPPVVSVRGGGEIVSSAGKARKGRARPGDTITAALGWTDIHTPHTGSASLAPGSRLKVSRLTDEVVSLEFQHGIAEFRAGGEFPMEITGGAGLTLSPRAVVTASVAPGEFAYFEGVRGTTRVDVGGATRRLRAGDAVYWVKGQAARAISPYREVGVTLKNNRSYELVSPPGRTTLFGRWECGSEAVEVTVRAAKRVVLRTMTNRCQFSFEVPSSGAYRMSAVTKSGEKVYEANARIRNDLFSELPAAVPKTFYVDDLLPRVDLNFGNVTPHLVFSWKPGDGVGKYFLRVAHDRDFKKIVFDQMTTETKYRVESGRLKEGSYFWRVSWGQGDDERRGPFALRFKFQSSTPSLWIKAPKTHAKVKGGFFATSGIAIIGSDLKLNGERVSLDESGRWSSTLKLPKGENWVSYDVRDPYGRDQRYLRRVDVE